MREKQAVPLLHRIISLILEGSVIRWNDKPVYISCGATEKEILKAFEMTERNIQEKSTGINHKLQMIDQNVGGIKNG